MKRPETGPIPLTDPLRRLLVQVRRARAITAPPTVNASILADVERALGGPVPRELLAYQLGVGRSLHELVQLTGQVALFYEGCEVKGWRRDFKFQHVAFDDSYSTEGLLCAPLAEPARVVLWFLRKGEEWEPTFLPSEEPPVAAYCRWKFSSPDATTDPVAFRDDVDPAELAAFQPMITGDLVAAMRRVKHPTFGEGRVIREVGPDKLEIDFNAGGVRTLLARFVEDVSG